MSKELSVVLWSKEGCHYCGEVKSFLEKKGISYRTVDVTKHDSFRDILEVKYGVRHVPVVEIGRENSYLGVTDIGIEHLEKALNSFEKWKK